ncbi:MAG: DUF378 domain-containing protein [Syntrophaceae bacterium]
MTRLNWLDWIAIALIIIGGINWGLIGFFRFDLVAAILGDMSALSRIIYALVGIAALVFLVWMVPRLARSREAEPREIRRTP